MVIQSLQHTSMQELADCFNLAFSDYLVPLQVEAEHLAEGLQARGVQMNLSAGAFDQGRLVGFVLTGIDTVQGVTTAYNAGTGVIPAWRGHQLTKRLYEHILPMLRAHHTRDCLLEVIVENTPALRVYEALGYRKDRVLRCYKGTLLTRPARASVDIRLLTEIDEDRWPSFWDWQPTWQNGMATLSRSLEANVIVGAFLDGELAGYLIYSPAQKRAHQFAVHKAYRRCGIGTEIFGYLADHFSIEVSVINVDGDAAGTDAFLRGLGLVLYASQYEMKLRLSPEAAQADPSIP